MTNRKRQYRNCPWLQITAILVMLTFGFLPAPARAEYDDGEEAYAVIVRVLPGVDVQQLAADYATTIARHIAGTDVYGLRVPAGIGETVFEFALFMDPRVVYAEVDGPFGNPEMDGTQIHFSFDRSMDPRKYIHQSAYSRVGFGSVPLGIMAVGVKTAAAVQNAPVTVAVLDSGVALDHPALQGHLASGWNAIHPGWTPDDVPDGQVNGSVGHGTMIAGLIARLAPDAQIMPIRVLNGDGIGSTLTVVAGIRYAITHGVKVINMSLCSALPSEALHEAMDEAERAGVVVVASVGNDGAGVRRYPAALENVIAVASVEDDNQKSDYSNFGPYVAVTAPGTNIRSTDWTGGYATWSGTSFAAPFVTAEAALILAAHPGYEASAVAERIRHTAHSVNASNPAYQNQLGAGLIDIGQALSARSGEDESEKSDEADDDEALLPRKKIRAAAISGAHRRTYKTTFRRLRLYIW